MSDADFQRGYVAGFDDATDARGGTRLAGCIVILAAVAILCAISFAAGRASATSRPSAQAIPAVVSLSDDELDLVRRTGAPQSPQVDRVAPEATVGSAGGAPTPRNANALVRTGIASNMGPGWPASYLALPDGPGWRVRICGPSACVERTSTDAGPSLAMQRAGRVADLSVADFERVSGMRWTYGLANVSVTVLRRPR